MQCGWVGSNMQGRQALDGAVLRIRPKVSFWRLGSLVTEGESLGGTGYTMQFVGREPI